MMIIGKYLSNHLKQFTRASASKVTSHRILYVSSLRHCKRGETQQAVERLRVKSLINR